MKYLVTWQINIDATTPEEAADLAREIQQDPRNTATFYQVKDTETLENFEVETA